jgi:hypothetical protein
MFKGSCFAVFFVFCFHCLSLHVSVYMAIFKCVGYFIFICLKDPVSLGFLCFHCLSLHASVYMAIFKCVGYLIFIFIERFCFAVSFLFSLSFTTCFGLHGHLQVCRIFYFHMLEGFCFAAFSLPLSRGNTLHVSNCVLFLFSFVFFFCVFCWLFIVCKQTKTHARKQQK